jgi:glutamate carboxypeptidase
VHAARVTSPSSHLPCPALDGLGIRGGGAHAPTEWADLKTVPELVQRTALLIYRLTR